MDTQHTGSDNALINLFFLKTDNLSFFIKGKFVNAKISDDADSSSIAITSDYDCKSFISVRQDDLSFSEVPYISNTMISPLFFEWVDYEVVLIADGDDHYSLAIGSNTNILTKISDDDSNQVYTGLINFHDSIGYSDLVLTRNGEKFATVTIEVYPKKLSYKKDYEELKNDVSSILYNLIYSALEKTFSKMILKDSTDVSPTETLAILLAIYERFRTALDLIIAKPHHQLISTERIMRAEKIQRVNNSTIKWIEKHPEQVSFKNGKLTDAGKIMASRKVVVFDTKENRYAKHLINETLTLIARLTEKWQTYANTIHRDDNGYYLEILNRMKRELRIRMESSFFRNVEEDYAFDSMSLVFSMAPGYKDLFKYHLMLKMGLSENLRIDELIFNLSLKGLSKLYEYWCFIKLNNIISSRYDIIKNGTIQTDRSDLFYKLVKGQSKSCITYTTRDRSIQMQLSYNPKTDTSSVNQIPDNVFSLTRTEQGDPEIKWKFIFDAKYRISKKAETPFTYKAEDEDINVMHRYRDAIIIEKTTPRQRKVVGAFVLYPYPDSEKEYAEGKVDPSTGKLIQHPNYVSIVEQNIGAFPFLPGHTDLLARFLDQIVIESPMETLSRTPRPAGFDYLVSHNNYTNKQECLVIFLDDIDKHHLSDQFEYKPSEYISIPESSDVLKKNSDTQFSSYIAISCNTGEYYLGNIDDCIGYLDGGIHYRFNFDSKDKKNGKLDKRGRKNKPQLFAASKLILSCSTSISDLKRNSMDEYRLNYAKKRLNSGIFKEEYNLPDYFKLKKDDVEETAWPLIVYNLNKIDKS